MKCILVEGNNLPEVWEKAVIECYNNGVNFYTQYDKKDDPPSKDCTMLLHVKSPFLEPKYHLGLPGRLEDVEKYVQEVVFGVHDYWMDDKTNPNRWTYTYHQRLFNYNIPVTEFFPVPYNQIKNVVQQLKRCPYTRRAQAITWQPWTDPDHVDPPCLQSLWFRIEDNKLNMNVRFRSNDLLKAAFMNMIALTELQKYIANEVEVEIGEYVHLSDSMHIYGKDLNETQNLLNLINKREFKNRTITSKSAAFYFAEGCKELLQEKDMPNDKKELVKKRLKMWELY